MVDYFKNHVVNTNTSVQQVHSMFVNGLKLYNDKLRSSIDKLVCQGVLKKMCNALYYTYAILDGTKLEEFLKRFESTNTLEREIENEDFDDFIDLFFYLGKGIFERKCTHLRNAKLILMKKFPLKKISGKFSKIAQIWERGHAVCLIQIGAEVSHYEALSRECATIKAVGLNNLTNVANSTAYGDMNNWSQTEILNFGNMTLFNALRQTIIDKPRLVYKEDVSVETYERPRRLSIDSNELQGILDCFIEL